MENAPGKAKTTKQGAASKPDSLQALLASDQTNRGVESNRSGGNRSKTNWAMIGLMVLNLMGYANEQWSRRRRSQAVVAFIEQNERLYQQAVFDGIDQKGIMGQLFRQNEANRELMKALLLLDDKDFIGGGSDRSSSENVEKLSEAKADRACFRACEKEECDRVKESSPPYTNWSSCLKRCNEKCSE